MNLRNKKVMVIGLGVSGYWSAIVCSRMGADVTVMDSSVSVEVVKKAELLGKSGIKSIIGGMPGEIITKQDFIIVSPSVTLDSPFLFKAKQLEIPIIGEMELGYRLCNNFIVAITGTNGKTTTSTLLGEILNENGQTAHVLGNNGIPLTSMLDKIVPSDILILETSAGQLESTVTFRPNISALLNIKKEHMNLYKSFDYYKNLKRQIAVNQRKDDHCLINYEDELSKQVMKGLEPELIYFSPDKNSSSLVYVKDQRIVLKKDNKTICEIDQFQNKSILPNALAAISIAVLMKVPIEVIQKVVHNFKGLEYRVEYSGRKNGVSFYNDSKATNPASTVHGILSLMDKSVILIAGGSGEKESDFDELGKIISQKVKYLIAIGETSKEIIESSKKYSFKDYCTADSLAEAVEKACSVSSPDDCVLFSPGCNSRDMFQNHIQRGQLFQQIVNKIQ